MPQIAILLSLVLALTAGLAAVARARRARRPRRVRAVVAAVVTTSLVAIAAAQVTPVPIEEGQEPFSMEVVTTELEFPWEVTWGPDDHLWVTERQAGRITRVNPEDGSKSVAVTIDEVHVGPQHEGLLGMALHPELSQGSGNDYVYVYYTYNLGSEHEVDRRAKIRRYTYDPESESLTEPFDVLTDLEAGNDHNAGRLVWGPDDHLYLSTGEQGHNQFGNFLKPINAQLLPTASQVSPTGYEGKVLRIGPEGEIPENNPELNGVTTHVYTYGHRNPQGIAFGPDGTLYAAEHGPRVDDELNVLEPGGNYGWPRVAGYQDDQAYVYANWSEVEDAEGLVHDPNNIPDDVPLYPESEFDESFVEPIQTFWTVEEEYDFTGGCGFVCWPTIAPSSVAYYEAGSDGVQAWDDSLLITTLKHGAIYRQPLADDGKSVDGDPILYFNTQNRYRDLAISPDGRTIFVATDVGGSAAQLGSVGATDELANPGSILAFRYQGEDAEGADFPSGDAGQVAPGGEMPADESEVDQDADSTQDPQDPGTPGEGEDDGQDGTEGQDGNQDGDDAAQDDGAAAQDGADTAANGEDGAAPQEGDGAEDGAGDGASDDAQDGDAAEDGAAAGGADMEALMAEGQEVFSGVCAGCHGAEAQGAAGPGLAGNENLADAEHVLDVIHHGQGFMPPFEGQYSDREIAAVATFVRNSWGNDFGPVSEEESAALR